MLTNFVAASQARIRAPPARCGDLVAVKTKHLQVSAILIAALVIGGLVTLALPMYGVEHSGFRFAADLSLVAGYGAVSLVVAALAFVAANWARAEDADAPDHVVGFSVIAGIAWPVIGIGLIQLAALTGARRLAHLGAQSGPLPSPARPPLVGTR